MIKAFKFYDTTSSHTPVFNLKFSSNPPVLDIGFPFSLSLFGTSLVQEGQQSRQQ